MKNCLEGYLTTACATCPDWADGTDDRGIGCAAHYPIMWCTHFAKMFEQDTANMEICQNCMEYNKDDKTCKVIKTHTAWKNKCAEFSWR